MTTNQRIPTKISSIEGVENQTFLYMCLSLIAEKRPDFNEICAFIGEDCFIELFNIIKTEEEDDDLHIYDEILTYFNIFGDDPEASLLFGKIILKTNDQFRQTEARLCFSQSAAKGNSEAMVKSGEMFETEGNKEEALRYFKMAAEKNNVKGMKIYADKLYNGEKFDENKAVAFDYYKKAAKKKMHRINVQICTHVL